MKDERNATNIYSEKSKNEFVNFVYTELTQECGQNLKQVPQNFVRTFNVEDVTLTSHLMTSYRRINIASEKNINYRVTSPSSHHCCKINIIVRERSGILVIIHFTHFLRYHSKIFKLLEPVYSYACILTSLYQCIDLTKSQRSTSQPTFTCLKLE